MFAPLTVVHQFLPLPPHRRRHTNLRALRRRAAGWNEQGSQHQSGENSFLHPSEVLVPGRVADTEPEGIWDRTERTRK